MKWLIRFFGLKGSWRWACRQMQKGNTVYRTTDSGAAKYRLDDEYQARIEWSFTDSLIGAKWENANIFLKDFECISWAKWPPYS